MWHGCWPTTRRSSTPSPPPPAPPRQGERDGVNYYFVSKEDFERKLQNDEIVEHTCYCGNYYGTLRSEIERHMRETTPVILVIEVEGRRQHQAPVPRRYHRLCAAA